MSNVATFQTNLGAVVAAIIHYSPGFIVVVVVALLVQRSIFLAPVCIVHFIHTLGAHSQHIQRDQRARSHTLNTDKNTHNTSYFMYIHTYIFLFWVFLSFRSYHHTNTTSLCHSFIVFIIFVVVVVIVVDFLFCFSVPFTLLVSFCASPFDAESSFIINKRVQSIKWNLGVKWVEFVFSFDLRVNMWLGFSSIFF